MIAILTDDRLFGVMLKSALEEIGLAACVSDSIQGATGVLCDLDYTERPEALPTVTFSKDPFSSADFLRPFAVEELLAYCRHRFSGREDSVPFLAPTASEPPDGKESEEPAYTMTEQGVVCFGESIPLSPTEHRLFACLLSNRGKVVSTAALSALLGEEKGNSPAVYMNFLRKKLDYRFKRRLIVTERGKGYCLL